MTDKPTLMRIKDLLGAASALRGFNAKYDELKSDKNNDKIGFGFGLDNRFAAFKVSTSFDSWRGVYGDSGCSPILRVNAELVSPFIIKAMNINQRTIFLSAADLMKEEGVSIREKAQAEIKGLQDMLASIEELSD